MKKMVKQLNVFSENQPGKLEKITGVLADANVNIMAMKISSEERRYKRGGLLWVCGGEREEGDNSHGGSRFHCCRENT